MGTVVGTTNTFRELPKNSRQLQGDYPYLQEVVSYGRFANSMTFPEINKELLYNIPWDCYCGAGVFGRAKDVAPIFEQLKLLMESSVDQEDYAEDLLDVSNPTRLALYNVPNSDFQVIIAAGYYQESTKELQTILENAVNVYCFECGANYSNDGCPIEDFVGFSFEDPDFPVDLKPLAAYLAESIDYERDE